jgi:putative ABC transport system permease protein
VTGRLAVENAARSPKRTAATSAALLIGVALVGFITVLGASMREAVTATVSQGVKADVIASSLSGFGPPTGFSPALVDQIGAIDGVETVSAVGFSQVHLEPEGAEPSDTVVFAIDPATVLDVMDPVVVEGDLSTLTPDQIVVDEVVARQNGISVGDSILVVVPGGASRELTVAAVSDDQLLNPYAITQQAFQELVPEALDMLALVDVSGDADVSTVQSAVEDLFRDQPFVQVLDHDAFVGSAADQITGFVNFIYIMLALSVIIALIGVANTLSLSIHERTREIGLLRAIGGARDQIRSSFRWEAAIVSVIGTLVGLGIALLGSYALVRALGAFDLEAFVLPIPQLLAILAGATVLGVLASLLPSRRAARLDILEAIAQS